MRDEDLSWVTLVGYQHEVVHTRVLERLLTTGDGPHEPTRVTVARALAGDDVVGVDQVQFEHQLTQRRPRRVLDLVADLHLADDARVRLGVETKVDSLWSRPQLTESVVPPDRGCLLAVGMTGLAVTAEDLRSLVDSARWSLLDAARWTNVLDSVLDDHPGVVLSQYRDAVRKEAADIARARDAVARGADVTWGTA